jgi:hypothetical protein
MLEIRVTIDAPDLTAALNALAISIQNTRATAPPLPVVKRDPSVKSVNPVQEPIAEKAPTPPAAPSNAVPVTAPPTYSIEQLQTAGQPLLDANKGAELVALLRQFGVSSLPELKPEQIGPFATGLRQLGAVI